jgi:hypothetical protein
MSKPTYQPLLNYVKHASAGVITAIALCSLALEAPAYAAGELPPAKGAPIVGSWSWQGFDGRCSETFQYRANGTLLTTSGQALKASTFDVSPQADAKGFYHVVETRTQSNGKPDCAGDIARNNGDGTGIEAEEAQKTDLFIQFNPARDRLIVCRTASLDACFGPLSRVTLPGQ